MASMMHEGLLLLFRNRPALAPELLRDALGLVLPAWSEARVGPTELNEVVPTEYRADLVVLLLEGKPVFAIVVEVQLSRSESKRRSWPAYLTSLRSRMKCPTALLVVAPDASVARWCARPIELGHPGFVLKPLVLGPEAIPVMTDKPVVGLDEERARLYVDLAMSSLSEAARRALEERMQSGTYEYQSEFARKYVAQGRAEGRLEGEVAALLKVLEARGLRVDAEARRRILTCTKLEQLERWLFKAVTAHSVQELFARGRASKSVARKPVKRERSVKARKPSSQR